MIRNMKSIFTILIFTLPVTSLVAQQETFDLATYTIPAGWKKTLNTKDAVSLVITDTKKGTYCQIGIYASTASKGSLQADFESEWQGLIVKPYKPTKAPELIPSASENGWDAKGGAAPFEFNGGQSAAMLLTMTSHDRCMSIVVLTNTSDYQTAIEKFLESVDLRKIEAPSQPANSIPVNNSTESPSILGMWSMSASDHSSWRMANGVMDYIIRQYTLNEDGTYTFISKAFDPLMDKILLGEENGTYQISGNNLTIIPQKNVLEAWSKKDNADKWGRLLTTQNIALEKVTYQFTKYYSQDIREWELILQAGTATKREGPFASGSSLSNAYYYSQISGSHPVIVLPEGQWATSETKKPPASSPAIKSSFTFNTTNFDDGWISTEQGDWVQVLKGSIRVLIHYPNKNADGYNPVVLDGLKIAWNILVAPKYSTVSNLEFKPINGWQAVEFAEADAVEKVTGESVHIVLFKKNSSNSRGNYMEFITPDKNTYQQEFGAYRQESSGWEKVEAMATYNKFAVGAGDLKGKWTSNFTGMTQYVNAYTGADAGATSHASNESFEFIADNSYNWNIGVATGMVGNSKFQSAKSSGTLSLPNNWQIYFSDLEGKPKTFNAYFSCVKGTRILWLEDSAYPIGYTAYGKKE